MNWKQKRLSEVCDKISLNKIKIKQKDYLFEGKYPVIDQGQELIGGYYNNEDLLVPNDPPYIIFGDHTKVKKFIPFRFIAGADGVKVLKAKNNILPKFLYYLLHTIKIENKGYARHFQLLEKETFLFPENLPEQRAIVKKLESLFSSLDAGVADLKKAQQQLKIYRQAVLRKSLDAKERISISELIQNLSQGWSPKCLSENVENNEEWAVIKTTAVQHGEFLPYENKKLPTDLEPREQHQIEIGDILITRAGPRIRVGVCCLVRKTKLKLINCDKVYRIKLKETFVLPEYFELVLNSPDYLKLINDIKTGSSDSGLNLTQDRFLKLEIPLPSIKEQIEIIKQIESRLSVCDSIEQNIKESLEKAEALRQSILKKAFEGNLLTAQELAECKLAEDYEPAGVLLEKIKAKKIKK
ncbi:type I restriction enzyme S subunit [Chryseobacterium ginsenosidimutans]|uniref:restriction endonuclease subunit S n=1 Tax=Chryseobacterium ginsenosidimutans TaxID=687846 RepID=UPI00216898FA|nr:restriction endonuclease subunit S [Chryseobacterium ginsenosidimutans]MCS3870686.1 type I restriction enzyme S subunit [Chryseobacterium ginsenosidimutans]